jgi:hypothetical protein
VHYDRRRRLDGFRGLLQCLALGFQLPHPVVHAGRVEAVLDRLHDRLDLALDCL